MRHLWRANSPCLSKAQKSNLLVQLLVFNSNFLSILLKPLRTSGAWRHLHSVTRFVSDYCEISEWHLRLPVHARVNTCINVCTYLTHVLSRKVLSLTKPKGMNRNPSAIILQICLLGLEYGSRIEDFRSTWLWLSSGSCNLSKISCTI